MGDLIGEGVAREHGVPAGLPNLAARLQARSAPNAVVIAENTRCLTGGLFDYRPRRRATQGFAEKVRETWQVTGLGAAEAGSRRGADRAPLLEPR